MSKIDCCKVRFLGSALLALVAGTAFAGTPAEVENLLKEEEKSSESTDSIPGYDMLEEFEITATSKVITSDGTKLTYNAEEDPAASGKSVLEMLRNVPMVSIDGEDNIKVNGKDGVKFYLNGKEEPMLSANASQILKAMPSSAVSKIEIIHEPGAKYDAEGNAGIINIITERKQKTDGYNGSLSATLNSQQADLSAFGMFKHKNLSASANISYARSTFMDQTSSSEAQSFYTANGNTLTSNTTQRAAFDYLGGGLSLSYEPDESNLFTLSANAYNVNARIKSAFTTDRMFDPTMSLLWQSEKEISGKMKHFTVTSNAGYQHTFSGNPQHTLILSYQYNFGRNPFNLHHRFLETINLDQDFSREEQYNFNYNRENTAQIDYSLPLDDNKHIVGIGAKAIFRNNSAYSGTSYFDDQQQIDDTEIQNVGQFQDIYAAYATYGATFVEKLNVNAGLRYEHTRMGMNFEDYSERNFSNRLNDIVPNAGITYSFDPVTNLRLAYQMRISRPALNQVNPFMMETTANNFQSGNPDLKSEHSNLLTLAFTKFARLIGGNIGIELFDSRDMIQSYTRIEGYNKISTFANIGSKRSAALTGFVNYQISPAMSVNLNGRVEYGAIKAPSMNARHYGWNANFNGGWSWNPEKIARFSIYGGYSTRSLKLQGWYSGYYYYSLSASRSFLADKSLTLTISAMNFLQDKATYKNVTNTPELISTEIYRQRCWSVGATLTWNFGNYQGKVKQISTSIDNDDRSSASNKSQGGF